MNAITLSDLMYIISILRTLILYLHLLILQFQSISKTYAKFPNGDKTQVAFLSKPVEIEMCECDRRKNECDIWIL